MNAPKARKIKKILEIHNDKRNDPYFWMNERENPDVIQYLEDENSYSEFVMKETEDLQNQLYEEMKSRYKKDDISLPYFFNHYWYITRFEDGKEYPIYTRKHLTLESDEEILLDVNALAEGEDFFDVGGISVSLNNEVLSYSCDNVGRRIYKIFFKNLKTGNILSDEIENTTGKTVWSNDHNFVFYIRKDEFLRPYQIYRHEIGSDSNNDVLIFHEVDETYYVGVSKTKSLDYILITSASTNESEVRFIPANDVSAKWKLIQPRTKDLEYGVEHFENEFYIITNADQATNFKIVKTKIDRPSIENWREYIPHNKKILIENFEIFQHFFVVEEREKGLLQIKIIDSKSGHSHYLPFSDPTYTAYIGTNKEFETEKLRYIYMSLTQPPSFYDYNMKTKTNELLKEQEVLGGQFFKENYISERIWADARDGKKIPISLVYHKETKINNKTPLLLYGYGSYGHTVDASFSSTRLSLLDRGFVFAIAHIRGGEYLGREWYEEGKMLNKKNTFFDFIDCAKHLIFEKYTSSKHLYAMGGSAGGLLIGTVINYNPELFNGVVSQVPFVDVVTTMLDDTIPLTTGEYDEWGNPNDKAYYDYMKSYSPYDNIEAKNYPNILITTGLHDSQVQYWEPAKWTAKLRDLKTDNNILIFKTDMSSGHGGASGRFESLKEDAFEYAFLIKLEGLEK